MLLAVLILMPAFSFAQNYSNGAGNLTSNEPWLAGISAEDVRVVSYLTGFSFGQYIKGNDMGALYIDQIVKGIKDAVAGIEVDEEIFYQKMNEYMEKRQSARLESNKAEADNFFKANAQNYGVVTTSSGLQYKIIRQGNGIKPGPKDTVEVNYEGKLLDGTTFDSSYERGESATFAVDQVIQGWSEGIQHCSEGGKIQLWIPAELAYGDEGAGPKIGPGAALIFTVELVKVSK